MSLGWKAKFDIIELNKGDWIYKERDVAGALPAGTVAELIWEDGTTWPATISGDTLEWHIEAPVAALIPNDMRYSIMIRYPNPDAGVGAMYDYEWRIGRARRLGNS